jgi:hypothetical protein
MKPVRVVQSLLVLICTGGILGCTPSPGSNGSVTLGSDGSVHPDATASFADFSGQGDDGMGWSGNSSGEGGPSAELPTTTDRTQVEPESR